MKKIRGYVLAVIGIVIIWVIFGKRIQEMMDNVRMPRIGNITQSQPTTPRQTPSPITPTIQPPFAVSPPASTTVTPSHNPFTPTPTNPFIPPFVQIHTPITPYVQNQTPITPYVQNQTPITTSRIVDSINPITGGEVFTPIMWASTTSGMGGTQPSVGGGTGLAEIAW